jgi:hypothetical protein
MATTKIQKSSQEKHKENIRRMPVLSGPGGSKMPNYFSNVSTPKTSGTWKFGIGVPVGFHAE